MSRTKIQDDANDVKPKGLDDKLEASDRRLILRAKNASSYVTVQGTIVTGTVFAATEFCDFFVHVVMLHPPNLLKIVLLCSVLLGKSWT